MNYGKQTKIALKKNYRASCNGVRSKFFLLLLLTLALMFDIVVRSPSLKFPDNQPFTEIHYAK